MFLLFFDGADDLGLCSQYFWQLIEIGCQLQFNASGNVAEGFCCNEKLNAHRRSKVTYSGINGINFLCSFVEEFIGCTM
jgi:hypothetical protein